MRYLKEVFVRHPWLVAGLCVALLVVAALAYAQGGSAVELKVGDVAPAFALPGSDGKTYALDALKGQTVVLAWFPKAFTGG
jgi:cytochrome oxidase Cu insertion factor (SCO1/SenC/PrrC family)